MSKRIGSIILGGTGFGAGELMRLLLVHPDVEVIGAVSGSSSGKKIGDFHPQLKGFFDTEFLNEIPDAASLSKYESICIFSALPHGASGSTVAALAARPPHPHTTIVDLSGDLRLKNDAAHEKWYGKNEETESIRKQAIYSLPEISKSSIKGARVISNPGCLASASILALAPLVGALQISTCSISAITGSSGAGRSLSETTHHATRHANFGAYKIFNHQHEPEICEALSFNNINFVAHRAPISRGIFVTAFCETTEALSAAKAKSILSDFYAKAPFVRVVDQSPEIENVVGSNFCDIAVAVRDSSIVVMTAIDNLMKGMAGTAIQNMNLALGISETAGLWSPSLRPI